MAEEQQGLPVVTTSAVAKMPVSDLLDLLDDLQSLDEGDRVLIEPVLERVRERENVRREVKNELLGRALAAGGSGLPHPTKIIKFVRPRRLVKYDTEFLRFKSEFAGKLPERVIDEIVHTETVEKLHTDARAFKKHAEVYGDIKPFYNAACVHVEDAPELVIENIKEPTKLKR